MVNETEKSNENKLRYYAGIGSRNTPKEILLLMRDIATRLARLGYVLRSGGAVGADSAFFRGCTTVTNAKADIWLPWVGFSDVGNYSRVGNYKEIYGLVEPYHPAWNRCKDAVKRLHSRNYRIVMGDDDEQPSEFVVCWTPGGAITGGTGLGMRLAKDKGIPIYNLYNEYDRSTLDELIKGMENERVE